MSLADIYKAVVDMTGDPQAFASMTIAQFAVLGAKSKTGPRTVTVYSAAAERAFRSKLGV